MSEQITHQRYDFESIVIQEIKKAFQSLGINRNVKKQDVKASNLNVCQETQDKVMEYKAKQYKSLDEVDMFISDHRAILNMSKEAFDYIGLLQNNILKDTEIGREFNIHWAWTDEQLVTCNNVVEKTTQQLYGLISDDITKEAGKKEGKINKIKDKQQQNLKEFWQIQHNYATMESKVASKKLEALKVRIDELKNAIKQTHEQQRLEKHKYKQEYASISSNQESNKASMIDHSNQLKQKASLFLEFIEDKMKKEQSNDSSFIHQHFVHLQKLFEEVQRQDSNSQAWSREQLMEFIRLIYYISSTAQVELGKLGNIDSNLTPSSDEFDSIYSLSKNLQTLQQVNFELMNKKDNLVKDYEKVAEKLSQTLNLQASGLQESIIDYHFVSKLEQIRDELAIIQSKTIATNARLESLQFDIRQVLTTLKLVNETFSTVKGEYYNVCPLKELDAVCEAEMMEITVEWFRGSLLYQEELQKKQSKTREEISSMIEDLYKHCPSAPLTELLSYIDEAADADNKGAKNSNQHIILKSKDFLFLEQDKDYKSPKKCTQILHRFLDTCLERAKFMIEGSVLHEKRKAMIQVALDNLGECFNGSKQLQKSQQPHANKKEQKGVIKSLKNMFTSSKSKSKSHTLEKQDLPNLCSDLVKNTNQAITKVKNKGLMKGKALRSEVIEVEDIDALRLSGDAWSGSKTQSFLDSHVKLYIKILSTRINPSINEVTKEASEQGKYCMLLQTRTVDNEKNNDKMLGLMKKDFFYVDISSKMDHQDIIQEHYEDVKKHLEMKFDEFLEKKQHATFIVDVQSRINSLNDLGLFEMDAFIDQKILQERRVVLLCNYNCEEQYQQNLTMMGKKDRFMPYIIQQHYEQFEIKPIKFKVFRAVPRTPPKNPQRKSEALMTIPKEMNLSLSAGRNLSFSDGKDRPSQLRKPTKIYHKQQLELKPSQIEDNKQFELKR